MCLSLQSFPLYPCSLDDFLRSHENIWSLVFSLDRMSPNISEFWVWMFSLPLLKSALNVSLCCGYWLPLPLLGQLPDTVPAEECSTLGEWATSFTPGLMSGWEQSSLYLPSQHLLHAGRGENQYINASGFFYFYFDPLYLYTFQLSSGAHNCLQILETYKLCL